GRGGVDGDREAEVAGKVAADLVPGVAGVVAAHDVPMLLHEDRVRPRLVDRHAVNAVPDVGVRVGELVRRREPAVDRTPGLATVVGAEGAAGGDRGVDAVGVVAVDDDGVQPHAAGARRPKVALDGAETGELVPGLAGVGGAEEGGVFDAGVDGVGIGRGGFQVPDALEFPGVLGAV